MIKSRLGIKKEGVVLQSEEHTSELQSPCNLVCRLLLEKKKMRRLLPPVVMPGNLEGSRWRWYADRYRQRWSCVANLHRQSYYPRAHYRVHSSFVRTHVH